MKKIASVLCLALLLAVCLSVLPTRASAAAKSTTFHDYNGGLTGTSVANVPFTENGTSRNDQSKLEARDGADGGKYAVFYPNYVGANPAHGFVSITVPNVYFADFPNTDTKETNNARYVLLEMDITTENEYINGLTINPIGRNYSNGNSPTGGTIFTISKDADGFYIKTSHAQTRLPKERGVWSRVSFLFDIPNTNSPTDAANTVVSIFLDGRLIDSGIKAFSSSHVWNEFRINQPVGVAVNKDQSFCFDNVLINTFDENSELASIVANGSDLVGFADSRWTENYDFPSVRALFDVDGKKYGSVPELEAALRGGETVTVLRDVLDTVDFTKALKIYRTEMCN